MYRIIVHHQCGYPPNPPTGTHTYGWCRNWVNMQVPAHDWKYTIVPA